MSDKHECSWCEREVAGAPLRVVARVTELEAFIRRRMMDFSKDSAMAAEASDLLNTEAKP